MVFSCNEDICQRKYLLKASVIMSHPVIIRRDKFEYASAAGVGQYAAVC